MSEDEKAEAAARSLDPRTAEVLRCLDRAKGTIAKTQTNPNIEATAQSLTRPRESWSVWSPWPARG
jgi:hypothetical protein